MITPHLEDLIHKGFASSRTFVCGFSQSCVIPVPANKYIVIHNIIYFPFFDVDEVVPETDINNIAKLRRTNKQIELRSQKSDNHFVVRDTGTSVIVPVNIDTYLVHFDDVNVSLNVLPPQIRAGFIYGVLPVTTVVLQNPAGNGGLVGLEETNLQPGQYVPANSRNVPMIPGAVYTEQLKVGYTPVSSLMDLSLAPPASIIDRSFPIVNIQYVLINKKETDKIQSSS